MRLHTLQPAPGAKSTRKRVGRGTSSGHGKTSGFGHKGQKARSGRVGKRGFEGEFEMDMLLSQIKSSFIEVLSISSF